MAGGIAYNGVGSSSGGTIFKDMVFWVALAVPRRNDIINLIKVLSMIRDSDLVAI